MDVNKKLVKKQADTCGHKRKKSLTSYHHDTSNDNFFVEDKEPIIIKTYLIPVKYNYFNTDLKNYLNLQSLRPPRKIPNSAATFNYSNKTGDNIKTVIVLITHISLKNIHNI